MRPMRWTMRKARNSSALVANQHTEHAHAVFEQPRSDVGIVLGAVTQTPFKLYPDQRTCLGWWI
jgi:hypothetical protein